MDVNLTTNTSYSPATMQVPNSESVDETPTISESNIQEKVMMDLKDVQNFLYMLIGSDIKVKSDTENAGNNINTTA